MDYKELSEYNDIGKKMITTIICRDKESKSMAAYVVKAKGSIENVKKIMEFIDGFGYDKVSLKSYNEEAIKRVRDEVVAKRRKSIVPTSSVPYHPQTHGLAEKGVQDFMNQMRKLKIGLEGRIGRRIPIEAGVIAWMVEHAATIINRHQVGHDGKVPYERVYHRKPPTTQVEFGEQIMAKISPKTQKTSRRNPLSKRIVEATWIGTQETTTEHIVALPSGKIARVRTVYRRPMADRWDAEKILNIKAVPNECSS